MFSWLLDKSGPLEAAAALSLCLLGGAAGAGTVWCALGGIGAPAGQSASVTPVILNTAAFGASLSDSQVCAAAVNSVVSINTTSQAGGGIFSASRCSPPPAALGLFSAAMATSSPTIMW